MAWQIYLTFLSIFLGDNWNCVFLSLRTHQGDQLAGLHDGGQVLAWGDKSEQFYIVDTPEESEWVMCKSGVSLKVIQNILNIAAVRLRVKMCYSTIPNHQGKSWTFWKFKIAKEWRKCEVSNCLKKGTMLDYQGFKRILSNRLRLSKIQDRKV